MKTTIKIILSVSIVGLMIIGLYFLFNIEPTLISGIENYDKNYYIDKFKGDLDSNLSIFPDDISNIINGEFYSSFYTHLFDSVGYIVLKSKYSEEDFNNEINRLSNISITVKETCYPNSNTYTNYIKYDENSYDYRAYITIDGFANTYEYALINDLDFEIIYTYLTYPEVDNTLYNKYLKRNKTEYSKTNTLDLYSIYNHSFRKNVFSEYDDC